MAPESEAALQHRTLPSQEFEGEFPMPFPGPQPTISQRRQYIRAFCQWYCPREDFESAERDTRHRVLIALAEGFIKRGIASSKVSAFEYHFDNIFWGVWFCSLPVNKVPLWPWPKYPVQKRGEGNSRVYESLKEEYSRQGTLLHIEPHQSELLQSTMPEDTSTNENTAVFSDRMRENTGSIRREEKRKAPVTASTFPETRGPKRTRHSKSAPEPQTSTRKAPLEQALPSVVLPSVEVMQHGDLLYPVPPSLPSVEGRRSAWDAMYPGITPQEQPFMLKLPAEFNFWTYVWGSNGQDFAQIQRELIDERVTLAWAYEETVVGTMRVIQGSIDQTQLPEVSHLLVAGFVDTPSGVSGTRFDQLRPQNLEIIDSLWHKVRAWYLNCTFDRMTSLRSYLETIKEARKPLVMQAAPQLLPGFKERQARNREERKDCETMVSNILDLGKDYTSTCQALKAWVMRRTEGVCLDFDERTNLAAHIWRERTKNLDTKLKISTWVSEMKTHIRGQHLQY